MVVVSVVGVSGSAPLAWSVTGVVVGGAVVDGAVVDGGAVVTGACTVVVVTRAWDSSSARACAANDSARVRVWSRCCRCASVHAAARSENACKSTDTSGVKWLSTGGSTADVAVVEKYRPSKIETATEAPTSLRRPFLMASRTASLPSGYAVSTVINLVKRSTLL